MPCQALRYEGNSRAEGEVGHDLTNESAMSGIAVRRELSSRREVGHDLKEVSKWVCCMWRCSKA